MLNQGDTRILAVICAYAHDESKADYLRGVAEYAKKSGYKLLVFNSTNDFGVDDHPDHPMKSIYRIINYDILAGIILMTESIKSPDVIADVLARARERDVPVVSVVTPAEGAYNITFDYRENFRAIISHVIERHQCKRIFFIGGIEGNSFSEERVNCYREEMEKHGLAVDERWIGYGQFWENPTYELMDRWLKDGSLGKPDAIIASNDSMALAACVKLSEYGYRIPEDVIVTGHDGIHAERYHSPRLTTAVTDWDETARKTIEVFDLLREGKEPSRDIVVKSEMIVSESCGCKKVNLTALNRKISDLYSDMTELMIFQNDMNDMASSLSKANDFDSFCRLLNRYISSSWAGKAWICMSADAYVRRELTSEELSDESTIQMPETRFYEGAHLKNVFSWSYGQDYIPVDLEFERTEILPNLAEKLGDHDAIFFAPIFYSGKPQGYIGMCVALENPNLKFAAQFMSYLNMTFEMVMQKAFIITAVSQLKTMYVRDFMTTLYNRRGFYTRIKPRLERLAHTEQDMIIVSVDMDGLKKINDTYGHNEGDVAIKALAMLLSQSADEEDAIIARFGGDEFIVAAFNADGEAYAADFTEKLNRKIDAYNEITEKPYKISASVGLTVTKPKNVENIDRLIEIADGIMYKQKEQHHKTRQN
ncbi:MAG: GGDEF domain-containing protein [Bacteroides sp.]|nr:GGDEF domain-containing protein [Eubacterium sp.]MCM1418476.1 GGDEF domain-containing protein [Roseburia sp.]MCM1462072.1 GGDEF domain-containing protein [Bacteroides sp.]